MFSNRFPTTMFNIFLAQKQRISVVATIRLLNTKYGLFNYLYNFNALLHCICFYEIQIFLNHLIEDVTNFT